MKKSLILVVTSLALLVGCGKADKPKPPPVVETPKQIVTTNTGWESTWQELSQKFDGVPKYSGAFGTYTNKHRPVAIQGNGEVFTTFSDNLEGNLNIWVTKGNERTLVHTFYDWQDPHNNAAINIDPDGYIMLHIASRGIPSKDKNGAVYKSSEPYSIESFDCFAGDCNDGEIWDESYPQPHNTAWGYHTMYTDYLPTVKDETSCCVWYRSQWSKKGDERTQLTTGAHYQISYYSDLTKTLYTAYNYHIKNKADWRVNLHVLKTTDGSTWTNLDGEVMELPVYGNSESTLVFDSGDNYVYLKDIIVDKEGKLRVLYTESTSYDPTVGSRYIKEFVEGQGSKIITPVGHNYNSGSYFQGEDLYIGVGTFGIDNYSGGDLSLYKLTEKGYTIESKLSDGSNWSYLRPVKNGGLKGVVSEGASDANLGSYHHYVEIK
tara:strand:+ start:8259 stop:9560 length:1302 start_codon:yes stop_codon:yes gene_type:complete